MTSRQWLKRYSLKKLQLELRTFLRTRGFVHRPSMVDITGEKVEAKHCDVFEVSVPMKRGKSKWTGGDDSFDGESEGAMETTYVHVTCSPKDWLDYSKRLAAAIDRYEQRLRFELEFFFFFFVLSLFGNLMHYLFFSLFLKKKILQKGG